MIPSARPAILLVDDDPTLLTPLSRRLAADGFDVRTANSGLAALEILEAAWPSLVVVDLMMPGMDGVELAGRIRRLADLPIIVVSAVTAGDMKISALEEFAEDYLTKPFMYEELVARIWRVLRRAGTGRPQVPLGDGDTVLDFASRTARTRRGTIPLTRTEVRLLQVLSMAAGRTVATDELLRRVWPESDGADPSYLWVTVRRLRTKLEPDPDQPAFLITDRGTGYRLDAAVGPASYLR